MGAERQSRVSHLYHAALARAPEERAAFLQDACGDDERLRQEIESLLGYESESARFLETPAAIAGAAMPGRLEMPRDFGSYRLIAPLGSGGMGDVYRARDTTLGRDVAVKVLPSHLAADPERRARFAREARVLATLNHPHIGAIYGLEEVDGITALILELVEGSTLADRFEQRPLSMTDALSVARQVADALEAAHEKGIIHRDLKPANILLQGSVGAELRAKVLDFGLAKPTADGLDGIDNPTLSSIGTTEGRILGTPAYMSPEQARGLPVDKRTDIWSFGCVLYEMLTGRRPFRGETSTDVMAAVVRSDPDWTALPLETPQRIRLLLARCLQKDPKMRLRDIGDARIELGPVDEAALGRSDSARAAGSVATKSRRTIFAAAAGLVGLVLAIAAGTWWYRRAASSPQQAAGTSSPVAVNRPLRSLTFESGLQTDPTFSPDGRSIAYASDRAGNFDIWVQPLDGSPARQITNSPAPETQPAWSPDGAHIVFRSEGGRPGLFRMPAQGGPATQLTSFGIHPMWSGDSSEVLFRTGVGERHRALYTVSAIGGTPPREIAREFLGDGDWNWIGLHPDGRISAIGWHRKRGFGFYTLSRDGHNIVVSKIAQDLPLQAAQLSSRLSSRTRFQWNDKGTALYVEAVLQEVRNIWRVRVDPTTLEWVAADRLTTGAGAEVAAALSHDGTRMVFAVQQQSIRLWTHGLDANAGRITGPGSPITPEEDRIEGGVLSPDGEWVAYRMARTGSDRIEAQMTNISTGRTELVGIDASPSAWSRDSRTVAYIMPRPGPPPREWALAIREVDGPERIIRPWNKESVLAPTSWTHDGFIVGSLYTSGPLPHAKIASWPAAASTAASERILLEHPTRSLWQVGVSPNGKWLAFVAGLVGESGIEMSIAREGAPLSEWIPVARDHPWADKPRWSPDGKLLYFISNEGSPFFNLWAIRFDPERGTLVGAPFPLTHFDSPALAMSTDMVTSQIGISAQRAMLTMVSARGHIWMLENVDR